MRHLVITALAVTLGGFGAVAGVRYYDHQAAEKKREAECVKLLGGGIDAPFDERRWSKLDCSRP